MPMLVDGALIGQGRIIDDSGQSAKQERSCSDMVPARAGFESACAPGQPTLTARNFDRVKKTWHHLKPKYLWSSFHDVSRQG